MVWARCARLSSTSTPGATFQAGCESVRLPENPSASSGPAHDVSVRLQHTPTHTPSRSPPPPSLSLPPLQLPESYRGAGRNFSAGPCAIVAAMPAEYHGCWHEVSLGCTYLGDPPPHPSECPRRLILRYTYGGEILPPRCPKQGAVAAWSWEESRRRRENSIPCRVIIIRSHGPGFIINTSTSRHEYLLVVYIHSLPISFYYY